MKYYRLNLIPRVHPEFAFPQFPPSGTEAFTYRMAQGKNAAHRYPENARILLEDGGVALPSFIGNTDSFFIVSHQVKELIERHNVSEVEYLPLIVCDYRERVLSQDYFIINPIGTFDCLNLEASEIKYYNGEIVAVKNFVADPMKLKEAPDLFRVPQAPREYFISQRLAGALKEIGATNIFLYEVDQSPVPEQRT